MSSHSTSNPTAATSNKTSKISPAAAFAKLATTASSNTKPGAPSPRRLTLNQATRAQMDATFRDTGRPRPVALTGLFGLSTCNSGFLSSLLADVAKAKEEILQAKRASSASSSASPSVKRRRISLENTNTAKTEQTNKPLSHAPKNNLLQEPCHILDLLWEESWLAPPVLPPVAVAANANLPPNQVVPRANIPATVSDAALEEQPQETAPPAQATRMATEDEDEDNFGWFVDMDEDSAPSSDTTATTTNAMICDDSHRYHWQQQPPSVSSQAMSSDSLAFSAPIAPKASNYDAELEWAKAADTVDDVLGDLF